MARLDTRTGLWRDVPGTGRRAEELIAAGAPVNGLPGDPETPLMTAASYGDAEVARALIAAGADLEATAEPDSGGVPTGTALLHAAVFGMTSVVDVLVAAGARVPDLPQAAAAGLVERFDDLVSVPADTRVLALVMAVDHERISVLDKLVEAGTPFDAPDPVWGRHPLRVAAEGGRVRSVRRLLQLGADPHGLDGEGRSALELCRAGRATHPDVLGYAEVERLLGRW